MDAPLLDGLADDERRDLLRVARRRRFARGEVIFHDGDPGDTLHLIDKGHVAVRVTTPLGDTAMLRVLAPGEFFGELALVSPGPRRGSVVALSRVETVAISKTQLDELRARCPSVDTVITEALVAEVRRLAAALTEALYLPGDKRLLRRLIELSSLFGTEAGPATVIPLTQDELAQLSGVTRPTANRILRRAAEEGILGISRGKVELFDLAALERQAG